ncbi:hypothetical protein JAB5_55080 [Janthinobacterium sp. HH103]|uniref:hypothetical protein n=1 Tax=unclassified Janthinobacterium TaxID=2610881 RepID=UPI000875478C|nr:MULTISPECIES: hypothetical protein [unclassified Janthinobacterium]OEZ66467.1 hypothetical protein JAB2_28970 [Janthinobacterium sp. HH100]OEZ66842.1 hypothetical protein JAB5_55080 [Janthinobacterium sp. HH103]OEZ81310.1 hypothetical protein JAB8_50490 [Janthinobacterium sp. HH106]QOU70626.1 hypothetical protein JAB4_000040 [Janthinobacterium sp. HH102]
MTSKKEGFLVYFDEARLEQVLDKGSSGIPTTFSDALSIRDWSVGKVCVALLGFSESTIDYICLAKRGKTVVTAKQRVEFTSFVGLEGIQVSDITARLGAGIKSHFIRASSGVGGAFPTATWHSLIIALKELRPHIAAEIDRVLSLQRLSGVRLSGPSAEVALQEREAIGISLDIFSGGTGLREEVLSQWAPVETDVVLNADGETGTLKPADESSFLLGLPSRYIQEESALQHDLMNWQGATALHQLGGSTFNLGDRRLDVVYANRNSLETTMGVDLIYYNSIFDMFTLVQYKLMRDENGEMVYRQDSNIHAELDRMDQFYISTKVQSTASQHKHFRLNDDGFFFKFVPNRGIQAATGELVKGMYCSREYVRFLLGPGGPKGPQNGTRISFKGAPRYLTNSQFSDHVHGGWLGSRSDQSKAIFEMVQTHLSTGRAVVVSRETRR